MKVKAIINFNDLEAGVLRHIGDEFEVSRKRADFLLKNNAVELLDKFIEEEIKELKEEKVEEKESQRKPKEVKKSQRVKKS